MENSPHCISEPSAHYDSDDLRCHRPERLRDVVEEKRNWIPD